MREKWKKKRSRRLRRKRRKMRARSSATVPSLRRVIDRPDLFSRVIASQGATRNGFFIGIVTHLGAYVLLLLDCGMSGCNRVCTRVSIFVKVAHNHHVVQVLPELLLSGPLYNFRKIIQTVWFSFAGVTGCDTLRDKG